MSTVEETVFRMALATMVSDLTYDMPGPLRADILDHLHRKDADGLSLCFASPHREWLLGHVLRWAAAQRADVGETLRKSLREEIERLHHAECTRNEEPPECSRIQGAVTLPEEAMQGHSMILRSDTNVNVGRNGTVAMEEVFAIDAQALQELHRQREYMDCVPFNTPMKKLVDAFKAIERGRVQEAEGVANVWLVQGSKGDPYRVTTQGCSCPNGQHTHKTRFNCYHAVAAELYKRWQAAMQPMLALPLPPITIDERLAQGSKEVVSGDKAPETLPPSSLTTSPLATNHYSEGVSPMAAPQTDAYTPEPETATPPSPEALKALRLQIIKQLNLYGFKGSSKLDYEEAVMLHVGLVLAPENFPLITERLQQLLDLRAAAPPPPKVLKDYMINIHGKDFVQFAGLLALAHERGLQSLKADFVSVTEALALATATATFADGRVFTEAADATPTNVNKGVAAHFARCALTRAKARALRDALNISEVAMEELEA